MKLSFVVAIRAFSRLSRQMTTAFGVIVFLSVAGALFSDKLFAAEGTAVSIPSIWAISMVGVLPILVSLFTMRLWSDDGMRERTESDLVVPVPERVFAIGRFLAAYLAVVSVISLSLAVPLIMLPNFSDASPNELKFVRFIPAYAVLAVLAMPLTAIGSMFGTFFRSAISSAVATGIATCAIPVAVYRAVFSWSPSARMTFSEAPVIAQVANAADGFISFGFIVIAFAVTLFALFASSKAFAMRRIAGGGRILLKVSSVAAILSALLSAALLSILAARVDFMLEWPGAARTASISARTRDILSSITHPVRISVLMSRDSGWFLPVSRLLRLMESASRSLAGAGISCDFVDPRWDPNAASRIVRMGANEDSIVFSSGRRRITLPAKDFDESVCASAIQRLSMPAISETVLFTSGHGEPSVDDFGPSGLGDAARALRQDGYRVGTHFSLTSAIPQECSVLVVVGARMPFSVAELRDIGIFVSQGGRLLVADSADPESGVKPILDRLGFAADSSSFVSPSTTDGSDTVVSEFGDHAVSSPLEGSAVIFASGSKRFLLPQSGGVNLHGYSFTPLCVANNTAFAVAAEKGSMLKSDLAIRPARLVVIGDSTFFINRTLVSRANANKDFFLNAVAWLAGLDMSGAAGSADNVLSIRMDRCSRIRFLICSSAILPAVFAFAALPWILRRKRRVQR